MSELFAGISSRVLACVAGAAAAVGGLCASVASASGLTREQVLVVYDSRIPDSRAVAEYYAGSAAVPGGSGTFAGTRRGVRVMNLATAPGSPAVVPGPDVDYNEFTTRLRNPIRAWLSANDPQRTIRCIVLTKGLSHRIWETNYPGEVPTQAASRFNGGIYCSASVDSELVFLTQDLGGTTNTAAGTRSTGGIVNPYYRQTLPINSWSTVAIATTKNFGVPTSSPQVGSGQIWSGVANNFDVNGVAQTQTSPGDMYLVVRLDAPTVADVYAMLDRAVLSSGGTPVDTDTVGVILDESASNGVIDTASNSEFDNRNIAFTFGLLNIRGGDDYEQTRYLLAGVNGTGTSAPADGNPNAPERRYAQSSVRYNAVGAAATDFLVGPRITYPGTSLSQIISAPIILLATLGANHGNTPGNSGTTYAGSFNYADGAVFNSIESYNGRQFGTVPAPTAIQGQLQQEQVADFIAAGGTFGVGTVWEPFAEFATDNLPIARNFLSGNLTWAEAAYSAIPLVSWQQVVIGDPLGRHIRSREDANSDGAIGIEDMYVWRTATSDITRDGTVTVADANALEAGVRASRDTDMRGRQRR